MPKDILLCDDASKAAHAGHECVAHADLAEDLDDRGHLHAGRDLDGALWCEEERGYGEC